jgi:hypothetical protein
MHILIVQKQGGFFDVVYIWALAVSDDLTYVAAH